MASTFQTWGKVCQYHNIPQDDWSLNGQYSYIDFKNGSRSDLLDIKFAPSDPLYERFGSLEYSDSAIEECGEIDFLAYDVLKTRIGWHLNKELGIPPTLTLRGNPKKIGHIRLFMNRGRMGHLRIMSNSFRLFMVIIHIQLRNMKYSF